MTSVTTLIFNNLFVTLLSRCCKNNFCESLVKVSLPSSLKKIEDGVFIDCSSLQDVVLQEGVESIGCYAFNGCHSLERITLPTSVEEVAASLLMSVRR